MMGWLLKLWERLVPERVPEPVPVPIPIPSRPAPRRRR